MHKRDVPYLAFGILITAVASCRSATDNNSQTTLEPEWIETSTVTTNELSDGMPTPVADEAALEPPFPSPFPTADDWLTLGGDRAGLALVIPPTWTNLTDQINISAMDNRLGINLIFAADSERTGRSLLAGKPFGSGAYVSGLIITPPGSAAEPATALVELLSSAAPSAVRLTAITPIVSSNGVGGFVVDVGDGPIGLNIAEPDDLRTRVALFTPPAAAGASTPSWIALLLSASAGRWDEHSELFDRMLQSARVFDVRPGL